MTGRKGAVAIVVPFLDHVGGMEAVARSQAEVIARAGHPVEILTCRHVREVPVERAAGSLSPGIFVRRFAVLQRGPLLDATWVLPGAAWLRAVAGRLRGVIAHQLPTSGVMAALANRLGGAPFCVVTHGSGPGGDVSALCARPLAARRIDLINRASFVTALNAELAAELQAVGVDEGRIRRVPNGCDTGRYRPPDAAERSAARASFGLAAGDIALVFTGRLASAKRLDLLLDAVAGLRGAGRPVVLLAAGEGPDGSRLERLTAERRLGGAVRWLGAISDVRPLLHAADVFCLPSAAEGMSMALLEAMASAVCPCVSDAAGNREVVAHAADGIVVSSSEADGWTKAIGALTADLDRCHTMGRAARDTVVGRFSNVMIDRVYLDWIAGL